VELGAAAVEGLVAGPARAEAPRGKLECRLCGVALRHTFADLGSSPLANAYPTVEERSRGEVFYPLHAYVCESCLLVQLPVFESPEEIFTDYAYFASYSDSWVEHARRYVADVTERLGLGPESSVIEIASNDGYLLQFFVERGIPALGIEPARNVAEAARAKGVETIDAFFDAALAGQLAQERGRAEVVIGNNVLAHVPTSHDFVEGLRTILAVDGVLTMEFPHLLALIEKREFDTIYHEHFSYFSLLTAERLFAEHGLQLFDVETFPTHGGSLRIYAQHAGAARPISNRVEALRAREREAGLGDLRTYEAFAAGVTEVKLELLEFLLRAKRDGASVVAYGAAAKGVTLLNYCGVRADLVDSVVDRSPHKQGRYLPGTGLEIHPPERVAETRPDYLLVLAWNLKDEIVSQMSHVREWGCRFIVPIPTLELL
jgi:hypothetical protein